MLRLPRVVIAAAASGQGKTTVAVGLMAALTRAGHPVAPAKIGPDFIDPGYHALATGRAGRNLDPWLCTEDLILPLLAHGHLSPVPAALSIIEGVMGLYDGRIGTDGFASTAHIAAITGSPVILVLDISSAARTIAATVHGLATYDPAITVAGVILNKSGSARHADEVRRSVEAAGYPVLGVLPRDAGVSAPSRHLGLVPVAERHDVATALDLLAEQTATYLDLDAVRQIADSAADVPAAPWAPPTIRRTTRPVIAVAGGRAFTFRYAETDELIRAQGAEPVVFDPAHDTSLPEDAAAIYLGGGFPEMHAVDLAGNRALKAQIRDAVRAGMPTVAECAGMLYLSETVDGHEFVGAIPARAAMSPRLRLRYQRAILPVDSIIGAAGTEARGHEFHRTRTTPSSGMTAAWSFEGEEAGFALDPAGTGRATLHASYLHVHWAGTPSLAAAFCDAAADYADQAVSFAAVPVLQQPRLASALPEPGGSTPSLVEPGETQGRARVETPQHASPAESTAIHASPARGPGPASLDHHGDAEIAEGLVDFAVNVRATAPPDWLAERLKATVADVGPYPSVTRARSAIARRHGIADEMVLPTNGAAEAFTLIARGLNPRRPVIVHPQFTEPESALRRTGATPERVLLNARDGFVLHASAVPEQADLVMVGNPTNPTGVLHPRGALDSLRRPGRVLVVDEAFADAIPGDHQSLIGPDMSGVVVIRSLTKTWSMAGVRAGYVVADPQVICLLAQQQPHWSVSTFASVAMEATATPVAVAEAAVGAAQLQRWRSDLVDGLHRLGLRPVGAHAPFVLVQVGPGVHQQLRERRLAVRSCESFPGLDDTWVRIAVREPTITALLLDSLERITRTETPA